MFALVVLVRAAGVAGAPLAKREFQFDGWVKWVIIAAIVVAALAILGFIVRFISNIAGCGVRGTGGKPVQALQAAARPARPAAAYHGGCSGPGGTRPSEAELYHMQQVEWDRQQQQHQQQHQY